MKFRKTTRDDIWSESSSDRVPRQGSNGDDSEEGTVADTDFAHVRDLSYDSGAEGDEGAGTETVEGAEDDGGGVAAGGEPDCENDDGGEVGHEDHGVEAAEAVTEVAWESTAEDTSWFLC